MAPEVLKAKGKAKVNAKAKKSEGTVKPEAKEGRPLAEHTNGGDEALQQSRREFFGSGVGSLNINFRAPEQRALILLLLATTLVLLAIPCYYCLAGTGRASLADNYRQGAHNELKTECWECKSHLQGTGHGALSVRSRYARQVVSAGTDGLLMMVAAVLGGIGADVSGQGIFAIGVASLVANGFSKGFNEFVVTSGAEEFSRSQLDMEIKEVREKPDEEIKEMVCHYRQRGLTEDDARLVANTLSKYESYWVQHMLLEELDIELPSDHGSWVSLLAGVATCASYVGLGLIPLLGVILSSILKESMGPAWYRPQFATAVALGITISTLMLMGVVISWVVGSRTLLYNGFLMVAGGCTTSVLAFKVSYMCSSFADSAPPSEPSSPASQARLVNEHSFSKGPKTRRSSFEIKEWPFIERKFVKGIVMLWITVSSIIACGHLMNRMVYESLRVFLYGWLTCITTGFGALPFVFINADSVSETKMALANTVAGGMMLAASWCMVVEAHEHSGRMCWQLLVGLAVGCVFIMVSQRLLGDDDEEGVGGLHSSLMEKKHFRKAVLIFTVMFCHSAAEGVAVGVAFDKQLSDDFGLYIALLLAVHNMPEGLAMALVLVPRGVSTGLAAVIAVLTSVPQPLVALVAFHAVDEFQSLMPIGLAFAAGAMVYVSLHELMSEAIELLGLVQALSVTGLSFAVMYGVSTLLHGLHDH